MMEVERRHLADTLENHYRSQGWPVEKAQDGLLRASGPGGVTWLGAAVVSDDLASEDFAERLVDLASRRMKGGAELCPLDLLAAPECEGELRSLLDRVGLGGRPHVSLYSRAA
jgi:hypothetical protein